MQALFGQLLLGLINGAFYAMLWLGLAVIFGLLNIINFAHGAQYMMGAFVAWFLLDQARASATGGRCCSRRSSSARSASSIERTMLARLYKLDHLYGLLLTFGLALIIEGVFRNVLRRRRASRTRCPTLLQRRAPTSASWSCRTTAPGCRRVARRLPRDLVRDRADQARRLPARRHREPGAGAGVRHQRAADGHADLRLRRRRWRRSPACWRRRSTRSTPLMGANLIIVVFAVVVIGGMGSILGSIVTGFGARRRSRA